MLRSLRVLDVSIDIFIRNNHFYTDILHFYFIMFSRSTLHKHYITHRMRRIQNIAHVYVWNGIILLVVVCRSRMATLHGDHTIRITEISSGRNIQTLVGHPRSPWSVEFHKYHCNILVSGCLAGQVRIWDLTVS